jgi:hypothetical protein
MSNESVRDGLSPRAARKPQDQPEAEPAAPDQAEPQPIEGPPGSNGPDDWLAPSSDAAAAEAPTSSSATDWLAVPPPATASAPATAPADWLASEPESALDVEPGLEYEHAYEPAPQPPFEPGFEPGFEPELEMDLASDAAFEASAPRPYAQGYLPQPHAEIDDLHAEDVVDEDELEPSLTLAQRLKRIPPALVILGLGAIGSAVFMAVEVASHTAPVPVLTSAGVATGLIYVAVAIVAGVASYNAAREGRAARSYVLALVGGSAAIVACGSFAGALILFLAVGF